MRREDEIRLRHMLEAAQEAVSFARGRTREDLGADRQLVLSVIMDIAILGEAASRISDAAREQSPEIPWDEIINMRNRLIHAYFDINLDIVWRTLQEDLPGLISLIEPLVPPEAT